MKTPKSIYLTLITLTVLSACKGGNKNVSSAELEQQRSVASENASSNASIFLAKSPLFNGWKIAGAAIDSSQNSSCPSGDGWATVSIIDPTLSNQRKIVCSTYSLTLGCQTEQDFNSRQGLVVQKDTCNEEVPYPLKKVLK